MIKKLKFQIAFTISFILSFVLVLLLFTVNILNYSRSLEESYNSLEIVASSSGEKIWGSISSDVEESENQAAFRSSQFFSVLFDKEGEIIVLKNHQDSGYSDDELAALAGEIFRSGIMRGSRGYLLFTAKKYVGGTLIVFMDNSISQRNIRTMQSNSLMIGCLGIAVIGWISYALACWLVLPVKETFEKQKSFISDASHELKTPIAVISANVDVLEDDVGSNKWLQYIKTETAQMNGLISNLLMLSKIDSTEERPVFSRFNMSKTVEGAAMLLSVSLLKMGVLIECNPVKILWLLEARSA